MDAAMEWVMRLRDESLTEEDISAWMEWYESDERHKKTFDEMQEFWHFTGGLAALPGGKQRIARLRGAEQNKAGVATRWSRVALAASVLVAIGAGAWWQLAVE